MLKGLLAWSDLHDSSGRRVADYTLDFTYGTFEWAKELLGMFATFLWTWFMFAGVVAATIMSWVSEPSWLDGLTEGYENITRSLFEVINPVYIAVMTFVILMVIIMLGKAKSTSTKLSTEDINRITAGIGIMLAVCILVANPFALLRAALSVAAVAVDVVSGGDAPSAISVDALIRQPTLLIIYGQGVPENCAAIWSRGGNDAAQTCAGSTPTPSESTIILAALSLMLSAAALTFALVALWKFIIHLSVSIIAVIVIPWIAASTITKRRQFDGFARHGVTVGSHMLMAVIVQIIAIAGPALMGRLLGNWGTSGFAVLQMLLLLVSWVFLTGFLFFVTRRNGALSRTLKTDAHATLTSILGGSSTVNNALNRVDMQGRHPVSGVRKRITKGTAAIAGGAVALMSKDGKTVKDDVTDAQRITKNAEYAKVVEFSLQNGEVRRALKSAPSTESVPVEAGAKNGKGIKNRTLAIARATKGALRYATAEYVVERARREAQVRDEAEARLASGAEPASRALVPVNFTNDDVKSLSREVVSAQRDADAPIFGGRSPRTSVESAILAEVDSTIRAARAAGQIANVSLERVSSSGEVTGKMSATEMHRALRDARSRRGAAEVSLLNGGAAGSDDDAIRMTVNYSSAKAGRGENPIAGRVWRAVRRSARGAARNALLGSPATRGDVSDGWRNGDVSRAYEEVDRYHAEMKVRAMGGSPNARIEIPDTDPFTMVRATPGSHYGPVTHRYGIGHGDRID